MPARLNRAFSHKALRLVAAILLLCLVAAILITAKNTHLHNGGGIAQKAADQLPRTPTQGKERNLNLIQIGANAGVKGNNKKVMQILKDQESHR